MNDGHFNDGSHQGVIMKVMGDMASADLNYVGT